MEKFDSLKQLKELLDSGVLTQEEFEKEKYKILNNDSPESLQTVSDNKDVTHEFSEPAPTAKESDSLKVLDLSDNKARTNESPNGNTKKSMSNNRIALLATSVLVGLLVVMGVVYNIFESCSKTPKEEMVLGCSIGDDYDDVLDMIKSDPDNQKRGFGWSDDESYLSVAQKDYRGVTFSSIDFNFEDKELKSIKLIKTPSTYEGNPQQIVENDYNFLYNQLDSIYYGTPTDNGTVFHNYWIPITLEKIHESGEYWRLEITIKEDK